MAKKSTNSDKENPYFQKLGLNQGFPKYCSTSHPVCSFFGHGNLNNKSGNILLDHCKEKKEMENVYFWNKNVLTRIGEINKTTLNNPKHIILGK